MLKFGVLTPVLILAAFSLSPVSMAADRYIDIHCGILLDVEEQEALSDQHILVRNDIIAAVGSSVNAPAGAQAIDLSDRVCAPGLMDMHVHLFIDATKVDLDAGSVKQSSAFNALMGLSNAQTLLQHGFTTIRVPGDFDVYFAGVELKHAFERGQFIGPRMLVAPHTLSPLGGHGDANSFAPDAGVALRPGIVDGADEARLAVRREVKYGADWIKIMASGGVMSQHDDPAVAAYTQEEFNAFADETHRLRRKITAHVHGDAGARMAVQAGFDSLEHGTMLEPETVEMMAERGTFLIPTRYVVDWILERGQQGGITANNLAKAQMVSKTHGDVIKLAYRRGVKMAVGSDPIFPMGESVREFAALNRIIDDAWFVLRAGTIRAAELLELEDQVGSIKTGKAADIVAMPASPIEEMSNIEQIDFVMKGGVVVRHGRIGQ